MQGMSDWQSEILSELERALQARERGNEGQARVCARRAAGIAVREYLSRRGIRPPSTSAYDLLQLIQADPDIPVDLKQIADHLTVHVTEDFKLPVDVDLIAEAGTFCDRLSKIHPQA